MIHSGLSHAQSLTKKIFGLAVVSTLVFIIFAGQVRAAGVQNMTVTLSVATVSTQTVMTVNFTPTANVATSFTTSSVIAISWTASTFTGGASLLNGDITVTKPGDGGFTSATASGFSATGFNITITTSTALNSTNAFNIVIGATNKLTNPATAQNISVSFSTSGGTNSTTDFGSGIASVGNANKVLVTANVLSTLSFDIRTAADAAFGSFPAACSLGNLSTTTVNFCQYRLKTATNAASGFTVQYLASGAMTSGTNTLTAATGIQLNGGVTEGYGVNISPGTVTGASPTVGAGTFTCSTIQANCNGLTGSQSLANFFSYQSVSNVNVYTSNRPNAPTTPDTANTALVTHAATPTASTPSGSYSQTITYSVTGQF